MQGIYRFSWNCGRLGDIEGIFVADRESVAFAIGENVQFGEILGKHSDIHGVLEEKDFKLISESPGDIEVFVRLGLETGYNPLDYIEECDDEDVVEDEDEA